MLIFYSLFSLQRGSHKPKIVIITWGKKYKKQRTKENWLITCVKEMNHENWDTARWCLVR